MRKLTGLIAGITFLVACNPERETFFEDWTLDTDADAISRAEFAERWEEDGYWHIWDRDGDGAISEWEWNKGLDTYYGDMDRDQVGFNDFDLDNDGLLDSEEMVEGEFVIWDRNGDGEIDQVEFSEMSYPIPADNTLGNETEPEQ